LPFCGVEDDVNHNEIDTLSSARRLKADYRRAFRELKAFVAVRKDLPVARVKAWSRRLVFAAFAGVVLISFLVGATTLIVSGFAGLLSRLIGDSDWGRLLTGLTIAGLLLGAVMISLRRQTRRELAALQEKYPS
jgi:hypothetical protein